MHILLFSAIITTVLFWQAATLAATGSEGIFLRSKSNDFTGNFFYHLNPDDHKIYIKPRNANKSKYIIGGELKDLPQKNGSWMLHDNTGGPPLPRGRMITGISVGCEIIAAVDNGGRVYLYQPTLKKMPTIWIKKFGGHFADHSIEKGSSFSETLNLPPGSKDWTFSCSTRENPSIRRTSEVMHPDDIVTYYEDIDGTKIEFGLTATLYSVSNDGHLIHYWDTGLAPSFGRAFPSPGRGTFTIDSISAAGSMVFVSGYESNGNFSLYTKLYDYEINGSSPGERFSFERKIQEGTGEIKGIMTAWRRLPIAGWRQQPLPQLEGLASLSNAISINTTGRGNAERELRIEGTNAAGMSGYYFKKVFDNEWSFFLSNERLSGQIVALDRKILLPEKYNLTHDFSGILHINSQAYPIELLNFHHYLSIEEASTLRIYLTEKKYIELPLYTAEVWTFFAQRPQSEEFIGRDHGEDKVLTGTLQFPAGMLQDDSDHKNLKKTLLALHNNVNALELHANTKKVTLQAVNFTRDFKGGIRSFKKLPKFKAEVKNYNDLPSPFIELAEDKELIAGQRASRNELLNKILLNRVRLSYLQHFSSAAKERHSYLSKKYLGLTLLYAIANPLINILHLEALLPELGAVSKNFSYLSWSIFKANRKALNNAYIQPAEQKRAEAIIKERIAKYEKELQQHQQPIHQ